jgi:hypothetical protein
LLFRCIHHQIKRGKEQKGEIDTWELERERNISISRLFLPKPCSFAKPGRRTFRTKSTASGRAAAADDDDVSSRHPSDLCLAARVQRIDVPDTLLSSVHGSQRLRRGGGGGGASAAAAAAAAGESSSSCCRRRRGVGPTACSARGGSTGGTTTTEVERLGLLSVSPVLASLKDVVLEDLCFAVYGMWTWVGCPGRQFNRVDHHLATLLGRAKKKHRPQ